MKKPLNIILYAIMMCFTVLALFYTSFFIFNCVIPKAIMYDQVKFDISGGSYWFVNYLNGVAAQTTITEYGANNSYPIYIQLLVMSIIMIFALAFVSHVALLLIKKSFRLFF